MCSLMNSCRNAFTLFLRGEKRRWLHSSSSVWNNFTHVGKHNNSQPLKLPIGLLSVNNNQNTFHDPVKTQKTSIMDILPTNLIMESPRILKIDYRDQVINVNTIVEPGKVIEKKAARLIVIRRRKMKRHKLKKLRIKMKFEWAKLRQRREFKKEKDFQAELMGQIKEAERFDAAAYATEKIRKANEVILPKLWKGKRLPEFVIKELLDKEQKKVQRRLEDQQRRKTMNLNAADYKF